MIESTCVSELLIDRLLAGELAPDHATAARAHAETCAECGALLAHAELVARGFADHPPALRLPPRRRTFALAGVGTLVAAAAVIAVVVTRAAPPPDSTDDAPVVRTKGSAVLGFFVSHGGAMRRGQSGEVVAADDRLQLVTTAERAGWVAVSGVDGRGANTVYGQPQPLAAGRDRPLPFSIVLDDTLGRSTISAVFCPHEFVVAAPPADCTTDSFAIETRR